MSGDEMMSIVKENIQRIRSILGKEIHDPDKLTSTLPSSIPPKTAYVFARLLIATR